MYKQKAKIEKNKRLKENKGITLIALVITIIVLLILAGVSIATLTGNNGILTQATKAKQQTAKADAEERLNLIGIEWELEKNTGEKDLATFLNEKKEAKEIDNVTGPNSKGEFLVEVNGYEVVINNDGEIEGEVDQSVASLQPGEQSTETVKNNYKDKNGDKATIPEGFTVSGIESEQIIEEGLVIYRIPKEDEPITWDETVKEKYDQYVWIPCTSDGSNESIKYDTHEFTAEGLLADRTKGEYVEEKQYYKVYREKDQSYYFYETMPEDELESIKKYKGYYIGRYEAGIINETLNLEGYRASGNAPNANWTGYTSGNLVVQKGKQTWNYITRDKAKEVSENLDSNYSNVTTKLCSSYAWDTALKFIETQNKSYPTNSVGGNYTVASGGTGELQLTGYDKTHPCNIYDMGGNVYEWTTERMYW